MSARRYLAPLAAAGALAAAGVTTAVVTEGGGGSPKPPVPVTSSQLGPRAKMSTTRTLPAGCRWAVQTPTVTSLGSLKEVVGSMTWTCARDPNDFNAVVEVDFKPPGSSQWIALGRRNTGNPGIHGHRNRLSIPVTDRPGQYRTKGKIRVNGVRRTKTSPVVTLS